MPLRRFLITFVLQNVTSKDFMSFQTAFEKLLIFQTVTIAFNH